MEILSGANADRFTLRLKRELESDCDISSIRPSMFSGRTRAEIGGVKLPLGARSVALGEVFDLIGDPSQYWLIDGDCSRLHGIGSHMDGGSISVRGNAGSRVGAQMKSGQIEVVGNCGDHLAMGMRNGSVVVHGSAGDFVGGPAVGQRKGMSGGDCVILGNVGSRAGERMRRGTLLVAGNTGDYGATQMIAGTLIVMGRIGSEWAAGMRRGTIILFHPALDAFAAELTAEREFELSFLPLIWRHLESILGNSQIKFPHSRWALRQLGDRANRGLGEVLTLTRLTSL